MTEVPATITALGALVTAVGVILIAFWAYRAKVKATEAADRTVKLDRVLIDISDKVYALDERVDGRLSELLKSNREKSEALIVAARAEGIATGEQNQRDRHAPPEA